MTSGHPYSYYEVLDIPGLKPPVFNTEAAYEFLRVCDDPICNIRLAHWRSVVNDEVFWRALEQYQAANGGFKGGIDPDYTGDAASIHSTIEAMRIMVTHHQVDVPQAAQTASFLRQTVMPDGTWQELPEVLAAPECPAWYHPAQFRVYETACIAGYGLEIGLADLWPMAVRYIRQVWTQMPFADTVHPYWAVLLLLGRSPAGADRSIALDALDNLGIFVRKHKIDAYDCSTIVEVLDALEYAEINEIMVRILGMLGAAQDKNDGGIMTEYGEKLRPSATFNALMAVAIMRQRGLVDENGEIIEY
ncbi:MAG: hypothetical protein FWC40_05895 [Proteobacteria bacterium]|nr:hypothetical protein [Pseudomonadota bacterium]